MVEKIDRAEAPPPYRITEAKQTKESLHQGGPPPDEDRRRFQKESEKGEWGKFHTKTITIKPVRVRRDRIGGVRFRAVALRNGTAMLIGDLAWANGQVTEGALFLLSRLEDYFRLKGFRQGSDVPESFWAHGEEMEVGIPQEVGSSGKFFESQNAEEGDDRPRAKVRTIPWGLVLAIAAAFVVIAIALWQELR